MHKRQRGVTAIGWMFLLVPIAIVGYAGIRLAPLYMNYGKIVRVMDQVGQNASSSDSAQSLRYAIGNRINIEGIEFPTEKDFTIRRDGQSWVLEINYEDGAPFISNVSLVAQFAKTVRVGDVPE